MSPAVDQSEVVSNEGYCIVCDAETRFTAKDAWLRDHYRCERCGSIPRQRALMTILEQRFPAWRRLSIHESSPGGPSSDKLREECDSYLTTHYFPEMPLGEIHRGFRNENLAHQTFADASFDLVVTQDVMEHVLEPERSFGEIARTLKPTGAHIFTTPVFPNLAVTEVRARLSNGQLEHLGEPEYHGNPIDDAGSLVTVHWGQDIADYIAKACGMLTTVYVIIDRGRGLDGGFLEVMVSAKA